MKIRSRVLCTTALFRFVESVRINDWKFFDKTTLGYVAILEIQADTGLVGTNYSWVSSILYFGYLLASFPASLAFVKLPLGKCLAIFVIAWAAILACHAAAQNFAGLMVLRFFLGAMESTMSPGFSHYWNLVETV